MKKKPHFIVVGAPKCGTSSLHHYLMVNPEIFLSDQKELHYFSAEMLFRSINGPGDKDAVKKVARTVKEYEEHFAACADPLVAGDISPSYFHFGRECAEKIHEYNRDAKIVIMLRNPIEKTYSQYMHQVRNGWEPLTFGDALAAEQGREAEGWRDFWMYSGSTLYAENLRSYLDVFGAGQVKVIFFEDFVREKTEVLNDLCEFIGVHSCEWNVSRHLNKSGVPKSRILQRILSRPPSLIAKPVKRLLGGELGGKVKEALLNSNLKAKPEIEKDVRNDLIEFFRDDVDAVKKLMGRSVPWEDFRPIV